MRPVPELRSGAFTLVELMVVIAILVILITSVVALGTLGWSSARSAKTKGILAKLQGGIAAYQHDFSEYPPEELGSGGGKEIEGAKCLLYYLAIPQKVYRTDSDGNRVATTYGPYIELTKKDFDAAYLKKFLRSQGSDFQAWYDGLTEDTGAGALPKILDGWGNPIYYDLLDGDVMNPQGEFDPREKSKNPNGMNPGSYDMWSLGDDGKTGTPGTRGDDLGNW